MLWRVIAELKRKRDKEVGFKDNQYDPMKSRWPPEGMLSDAEALMKDGRELMDEAKPLVADGKELLAKLKNNWLLKWFL